MAISIDFYCLMLLTCKISFLFITLFSMIAKVHLTQQNDWLQLIFHLAQQLYFGSFLILVFLLLQLSCYIYSSTCLPLPLFNSAVSKILSCIGIFREIIIKFYLLTLTNIYFSAALNISIAVLETHG